MVHIPVNDQDPIPMSREEAAATAMLLSRQKPIGPIGCGVVTRRTRHHKTYAVVALA